MRVWRSSHARLYFFITYYAALRYVAVGMPADEVIPVTSHGIRSGTRANADNTTSKSPLSTAKIELGASIADGEHSVNRLFAPQPALSSLEELPGRCSDRAYRDIDVRGLLVPGAMRIVNAGIVTVGGVSSKAAASIFVPALRSLHGRPDRSGSIRSTV